MNDISFTFGVNFDFKSTEFELIAMVPKIRTNFTWNFYAICASESKSPVYEKKKSRLRTELID